MISGGACVLALTVFTMLVLGPRTYRDYLVDVLPQVAAYRSSWGNASVAAFWSRLFDPAERSGNDIPLLDPRATVLVNRHAQRPAHDAGEFDGHGPRRECIGERGDEGQGQQRNSPGVAGGFHG